MTLVAVTSLLLAAASLFVPGGALFALLVFFPLFGLALVGVLVGTASRTVQQHHPSMDPRGWRDGRGE